MVNREAKVSCLYLMLIIGHDHHAISYSCFAWSICYTIIGVMHFLMYVRSVVIYVSNQNLGTRETNLASA